MNPNVGRPKQLPLLRLFKLQPGGTCSRMWERARAGAWHAQLFLPVFFSSRFSMPFALVHGGKVVHPQSQTEATGHLPLTSDPGPLPSMQDAASQLHRPHELGIHSLWLWVRWPCQAIPGTPGREDAPEATEHRGANHPYLK